MLYYFLLLFFPVILPFGFELLHDPSPGFFLSVENSKRLSCKMLNEQSMVKSIPEDIPEEYDISKEKYLTVDYIRCQNYLTAPKTVSPRDQLINEDLSQFTEELLKNLGVHSLGNKPILVEAFYHEPEISKKIRNAMIVSMAEHNYQVTDRIPFLPSSEILKMKSLDDEDVYITACSKYQKNSSIFDEETLVAAALFNEFETRLHAGLCQRGEWQWLF